MHGVAHLCAHGILSLKCLGALGLRLLLERVGVLHDGRARLAQALGAPGRPCGGLQVQDDVGGIRAVSPA